MARILVLARENGHDEVRRLAQDLQKRGHTLQLMSDIEEALLQLEERTLDLVFVHLSRGASGKEDGKLFVQECSRRKNLSTVALVNELDLPEYDFTLGFTDFILLPYRPAELYARVEHILWRDGKHPAEDEMIVCGDLRIDLSRYEVYLVNHPVELTFKEYELLRFLATNPEKVYSREALLNRVWGYDYYGGARTVDVHIRRLRSKIEDAEHSFIETVRNVGYRFRVGTG